MSKPYWPTTKHTFVHVVFWSVYYLFFSRWTNLVRAWGGSWKETKILDILRFSFVEDKEGEVLEGILVACGHECLDMRLGKLEVQ